MNRASTQTTSRRRTRIQAFRVISLLGLVGALLAVANTHVKAQSTSGPAVTPGFQRDQAYIGSFPFEHIDTGSGNLLLTFTDLSLPGYNGLDLVWQRTFNSSRGWTFALAGFPHRVLRTAGPHPPTQTYMPDFHDPGQLPELLTPDGGSRRTWWTGGDIYAPAQVFVTADFWRYYTYDRRLELPNGMELFYDDRGYLAQVRDRFSNRIDITNEPIGFSESRPRQITQHLGDGDVRVVTMDYQPWPTPSGSAELLTTVTYENRTWTYEYGGEFGTSLTAVIPPAGPVWRFEQFGSWNYAPQMTVTLPQGGKIVYEWSAGNGNPLSEGYGSLQTRKTVLDGSVLSEWRFDMPFSSVTGTHFDREVTGIGSTKRIYRYRHTPAGPALERRETWDRITNDLVEVENRTYATTQITNISTSSARNLLQSVALTRDGRTYTTGLFYHAGTQGGRFADYGRPYEVHETGDAGVRRTERTFDYEFAGYLIDKIKSETVRVGTEAYARAWEYVNETGAVLDSTVYGVLTRYNVDANSGMIAKVIDAHNHETSFTYDWGVLKDTVTPEYAPAAQIARTIKFDGTILSETRRSTTIKFEHDAVGRLEWVKPEAPHPGHWTRIEYDNVNGLSTTTSQTGGGVESWTKTTVDAFGRPSGTENSVGVKTGVAYDAHGRKATETPAYDNIDQASPRTFGYDALNRLTTVTNPDQSQVTYRYENGIDVEITNEDLHVTKQDWAAFGHPAEARLVAVTNVAVPEGDSKRFAYSYNGLGQLTAVWHPGDVQSASRKWTYFANTDRVQYESHPESGTTGYTYDAAGLLETKTDARTTVFDYGYDTNDRLTTIEVPAHPAYNVTLGYDESDNVTRVTNSVADIVLNFNRLNKLYWRTVEIAGKPKRQTTYDHDGFGNVVKVTYPSTRIVEYDYDTQGRVTTVWKNRLAGTKWAEVSRYHPSGAIGELKYGNDVTEHFAYDGARRWLEHIWGGPVTMQYKYTPGGNVETIIDSSAGVGSVRQQTFTYDTVERLESITGDWGVNRYEYDAVGNRTFKALGGVTSAGVTYTYNARNQLSAVENDLIESGTYHYDAAGNTERSPKSAFTYTPFNMVATATPTGSPAGTSYQYDGNNQRVARFGGGLAEYFIRDHAGQVLSEWQGDAWRRDYIYLGGRLVAAVSSAAVTPPPSPPVVTMHPHDQSLGARRVATFTAFATGWPAPSVRWQVSADDGNTWADIPNATATSYSLTVARTDNGKLFKAVFTNSQGPAAETIPAQLTVRVSDHDFDGDGKTDVAVFRPNTGGWHVKYSGGSELNVPFGIAGDLPVAADYNGDGKTDIAVFRPGDGKWYVRHSGLQTTYDEIQWGGYGDVPLPGDYDGDGKADAAVYRPSVARWYVRPSNGTGVTDTQWGTSGDVPVPGDYDGDGRTDRAIFRPSESRWYILQSSTSMGFVVQWGGWGDLPVPADFDGDGQMDITVFRPVDPVLGGGGWYFSYSTGAGTTNETWGGYGDVPVPADYTGDGLADVVVYRPSDATWYFQDSPAPIQWGTAGDQPVPARLPTWKDPMYW